MDIKFKPDKNDGSVQGCSISTANAMEILQSCHRYNHNNTKPLLTFTLGHINPSGAEDGVFQEH